jgi:hypothetical protein
MNPISASFILLGIAIAILNTLLGRTNWYARSGTALMLLAYAINIIGRINP